MELICLLWPLLALVTLWVERQSLLTSFCPCHIPLSSHHTKLFTDPRTHPLCTCYSLCLDFPSTYSLHRKLIFILQSPDLKPPLVYSFPCYPHSPSPRSPFLTQFLAWRWASTTIKISKITGTNIHFSPVLHTLPKGTRSHQAIPCSWNCIWELAQMQSLAQAQETWGNRKYVYLLEAIGP